MAAAAFARACVVRVLGPALAKVTNMGLLDTSGSCGSSSIFLLNLGKREESMSGRPATICRRLVGWAALRNSAGAAAHHSAATLGLPLMPHCTTNPGTTRKKRVLS